MALLLYCVALPKCMQYNTTPSGTQQEVQHASTESEGRLPLREDREGLQKQGESRETGKSNQSQPIKEEEKLKNTKYLFNENKQTPEGMISVSQLQTFLSCRKKWAYGYIENLTPRVERPYLSIGKLCHKGMQTAMHYKWKHEREQGFCREDALRAAHLAMISEHNEYVRNNTFLAEEMPDIDQILVDAESVFEQAFWEFDIDKYEVLTLKKNGELIPALELHFVIPCPPTKGLHGYIDAILKDKTTGFLWCTDYKFRKSLSPDEEESFNIQNAVYTAACIKMGIPITGTMTWQHVNTPAAEPQLLKNGAVSRAKIKTTWEKYAKFCEEHGQFPGDYREEMQEKLAEIEWFRATYEYRNPETVGNIWKECVVPAARGIRSAHGVKANNFRSLYPWNCKMCQFKSLCQGELRNYDTEAIRLAEYTKRGVRAEGEADESELALTKN